MRPPKTKNSFSFNLSLYSTLSTTQTAATAQHKVKQRLTRRAGIASYWRHSLNAFGGAALAQCTRRAGESGSDAATLSQR